MLAQAPGDTLITQTFNYSQTQYSRDSVIDFPNIPGITYEKIYMLYNMRCKNGLVSPAVSGQTNIGCGEWDYTCNTYIMDSTKTDSTKAKHPSHIITGFNGTTYNYLTNPTYTYYQYNQQQVNYTSTLSENTAVVGANSSALNHPFQAQGEAVKSQYLWKATELLSAGVSAGDITSLRLFLNSAASSMNHLRIRMKHSTLDSLSASSPDLAGFTEVYFLNTPLSSGLNQFLFYNPFNWNGTDNLLIEFSFNNSGSGTNSIVAGETLNYPVGLVSEGHDYCFEFSGSNFIEVDNAEFNTFSNQLSIAFWAYGNPDILPANNSVMYGYNAQNHRQVNVHLPWSNGNIYWDCGSGGPYDRIDKAASTSQYEGQWNHYVFTKNSSTGIMNIYLNGTLWHTGSGKTLPVALTDLILGKAPYGESYFGKMDELSVWNTELDAATIQNWMYRTLDATHPNFANLLTYYKLDASSGTTVLDLGGVTNPGEAKGLPAWRKIMGKDIFKNFTTTPERPQVTFVQGVYTQTTNTVVVMDSVQNIPNTVYGFTVNANNIVPVDTNVYFKAGYTYVYDGMTGVLIDSVQNAATGSVNITDLIYFQRSPAAFQLVSFVTPYGINLDLGMTGKTWTFDVTDYAPILKGRKRMFINGGGERQEDMDIRFVFIVGTPPRNVRDINNLWKVEPPGYQSILNDAKYEPREVLMDPGAVAYKIRTAITGHGQEGEFIPRNHYININGGSKEFTWDVWKKCAENPVYPQGGTWIYDRAGWCPGMATDVQEFDISSYVTPGASAQIDYGLDTAWGSSNYWVSNQLVSYGPANFTLDAAVVEIKSPTNKVEYARTNPFCHEPIVVIQNTGSDVLTSLQIEYWVNNSATKESFQWTGNLKFLEKAEVQLPAPASLYGGITGPTNNEFHVEIKTPNNGTDAYAFNNTFKSIFNITDVVPSNFIIRFKANGAAAESSYKVLDQDGNIRFQRSGMNNFALHNDTLNLGVGCYQFIVEDTDEDGIDFWANSDGVGYMQFRRGNGTLLRAFEGDFGKSFIYNFTIDFPMSYEQLYDVATISIFPNPAHQQFTVRIDGWSDYSVQVLNLTGELVPLKQQKVNQGIQFDASNLTPGIYLVKVTNQDGHAQTTRLVIE